MNDAGLPNFPAPARLFEVTDAQLSAELKKWTGAAPALQPVGELLDRHWEAAFAYARLCTDAARFAGMLTTAAFTRLFGETLRHNGPTADWRPQVLVTVRRIAAEWDTDRGREQLHPDLRSTTEGGGRAAAKLLPSSERRLLSGAFQRLPPSARCLLWHHEVEAEPLDIPASLLGLDEEGARVELGRARERLREECLQVHRELAPEQECRSFLRMLDVTYRRGAVSIDPDLHAHLDRCKHCRHTADQLHQFGNGLGLALAEAVLGWGARGYVEFRAMPPEASPLYETAVVPSEAFYDGAPMAPRRAASRRTAKRAARRAAARRRNLTAAVATVSGLIVIPLVLWSVGNGDGTAQAGDTASPSGTPGTDRSTSDPTWVGSGAAAQGDLSGRLHNIDSGKCVTVAGGKAVDGAEAVIGDCTSAMTELWTYQTDGLLRSVADPGLCLDSHTAYSVRLAPCTGTQTDTRNVRYDFTLQGNLVPLWDQDLALTPAATDGTGALVLKNRDDDNSVQRWVFDTSKADPQMEWVNWGAASSTSATPSPTPTTKKASPSPTPSATASSAEASATSSAYPSETPCYYTDSCEWDGGGPGDGYGDGHHGGGWH